MPNMNELNEMDALFYQQAILAELLKISDILARERLKTNYTLAARKRVVEVKKKQIEPF